ALLEAAARHWAGGIVETFLFAVTLRPYSTKNYQDLCADLQGSREARQTGSFERTLATRPSPRQSRSAFAFPMPSRLRSNRRGSILTSALGDPSAADPPQPPR